MGARLAGPFADQPPGTLFEHKSKFCVFQVKLANLSAAQPKRELKGR